MVKILGISAFYHDSAACIIEEGIPVAAAQEERFTRKKYDPSFPKNAIKFCLLWSGYDVDELDAVVFYDKPFLKFERILETYYAFAPSGLKQFISASTLWIKEKIFLKKIIIDELKKLGGKKIPKILFSEHHLSHAASAFFPSPFDEAAILTVDGVGEWATASIGFGKGNRIKIIKEMHFPHSVGMFYSSFTYFLGFKVNSGEYKLMGLAPYGNPVSAQKFEKIIKSELIDIKEDGSIWLNQKYFKYCTSFKMIDEKKWEKLFGFPKREPESEIKQEHCDLAYAVQKITEEIILRMAKHAKEITGARYLTMAGGVALNCVANAKILSSGIFEDIWIQPAAGDAGGALGAALAVYHMYFERPREIYEHYDTMQGAFLGPAFSNIDIEITAKKFKAKYRYYSDFEKLCQDVAKLIAEGYVVGWFQGRMEWGPRALGARSILADPRDPEMQKKLNVKVKFRESFRPFAPAVLWEDTQKYFKLQKPSPYMLLVAEVKEEIRKKLPPDYTSLPVREKLYTVRSSLPAITHVDFSARVQTVHKETNPRFYMLIKKFKEITGISVLVNTSFNVRGEPIVCTPEDAYRCFMRTGIDYLVMENFLFDKKEQGEWKEEIDWRKLYPLD